MASRVIRKLALLLDVARTGLAVGVAAVYNSSGSFDWRPPALLDATLNAFQGNVTATGTISASNLSGTNTGDQTLVVTSVTPGGGLALSNGTLSFSGSAYDAAGLAGQVQTNLTTLATSLGSAAYQSTSAFDAANSASTVQTHLNTLSASLGSAAYQPTTAFDSSGAAALALTTFAGSNRIVTLGTVTLGTWNATAIADAHIASSATWNAKQNAITTGTSSQYLRGDLTLGTPAVSTVIPGTGLVLTGSTLSFSGAGYDSAGTATTQIAAFTGSSNISTVGNVNTGTWQASAISDSYIASAANWNAKQGAITTGTSSQYLKGDLSLGAVGTANGLATLDSTGKLTSSQLPSSVVGAVVYQGSWNSAYNTPALTSGVGTKGYYYKVSVASSSTTIDGISNWNVGDTIIFDGTTWDKIDGIANEIISVFGRNGTVTAQSGDYNAAQVGLGNVLNVVQLAVANNLSELTTTAATARSNLGLGSASVQTGTAGALVGTTDTQTLTNKDLTSGTNTFPTFNQNTTGTAANITAASNATLTTLSSLSLPASQITGLAVTSVTAGSGLTISGGVLSFSGASYAPASGSTAYSPIAGSSSIVTVGTLSSGSIPASLVTGLTAASVGLGNVSNQAALPLSAGNSYALTGLLNASAGITTTGGGATGAWNMGGGTSSGSYTFNGSISVATAINNNCTKTLVNGATSGNLTWSQPERGSGYKKVVIYCNALTGAATFTFSTAFLNTPAIVNTNGPAASVVTSLSTTSVTVTGSTTTGFILLEGY